MYSSKAGGILVHFIAWLLFISLIVGFVSFSRRGIYVSPDFLSVPYISFFAVYIALFYLNYSLLIPQLYLKKKYAYYFAVAAVLLLVIYFLRPFEQIMMHNRPRFEQMPGPPSFREGIPPSPGFRFPQQPFHAQRPFRIDIVSIILFVMIWSLGMALQIVKQWRYTEQRATLAEAEKATAELSFLKAQIHPHFLFNTLNNIYSMAVLKSEHTPAAILKLSNIMRYVTDEVKRNFVPLEKEVAYISDYIDLQRLRLSNKVQLDFSVTGNIEGKQIAPLILMTFVENVFKYGISNHEPAVIKIQIAVEKNAIVFFCQNRIPRSQNKTESTGIGISNTRKRLEHLYPGKHSLTIYNANEQYTVQLTLQV
ncbi:sensor histidine kinase [Chitinophagaceae bacterium LB-8]|uniref:Sensor histidine kinase n=1 Tax=Paraflavisolibacter caeni TaxID=2982496 RepID=A0A9X3BF64_9BACT|nr:sensor histidine kinase [Paraflavisolibacter caeni]MCU7548319.1 sensor histidine kinase [Paraflavisolibacter caeni]